MPFELRDAAAYPFETANGRRTMLFGGLTVVLPFLVLGGLAFVFQNRLERYLGPLTAILYAAGMIVLVSLQVAVYRDVVVDDVENSGLVHRGRDTLRLVPVVAVCFGAPLWLLATSDIDVFVILTLLPDIVTSGGGWSRYWSPLATVATLHLIVGSFVFPALLGALAETDSIAGTFDWGRLKPVLSSSTYAWHWLLAMGLSLAGLAVLAYIPNAAVKALSYAVVLALPVILFVELLITVYAGTVVSHIAAQGYASGSSDSTPTTASESDVST